MVTHLDILAGEPNDQHAPTLRQFAWFPLRSAEFIVDPVERGRQAWADALRSLADLAEPEEWSGATSVDLRLPILDSYVRYTYKRLVTEQKISTAPDNEHAAFNTGLLTLHAEDIFGLFERNRHEGHQRWVFMRWATESDRDVLQYFGNPPLMAEYVSTAANLVYD
jgi:Domain of unknown function (DUF3825)